MKTVNFNLSNILNYRSDIDGMRAIAVSAVLIYHVFPNYLPGGFVGVDIFFVISGYLISLIIFRDLQAGGFKIHEFYGKRIKRIFPTLLLVLLVVGVWGSIILLPVEQKQLWLIFQRTTIFLTNMHLSRGASDYFGAIDNSQKPLLHMWSLSIEEQFYVVYPILIWVTYKIRKKLILPLLIIGLLVSFCLSIIHIHSKQVAVFYLLHFRAWELLLGSILAYFVIFKNQILFCSKPYFLRLSYSLKNLISIVAIFLIIYPCIALTGEDIYPGLLALYPTIGAALLIVNKDSWFNRHVLANKIFVFIGLISYPLYLWHWPVIAFAKVVKMQISAVVGIAILAGSILAAITTTFLFEKPIRRCRSLKVIPLSLVGIMSVFFLLSVACIRGYVVPGKLFLKPEVTNILYATSDWTYPSHNLVRDKRNHDFYYFGSGSKKIVFFGDSNMQQYWPRIEKLMLSNKGYRDKYNVFFAAYGGMVPIPGSKINDSIKNKFLSDAIKLINEKDVDTVVFGASWFGYFDRVEYDEKDKMYQNFESTLVQLIDQGKKVFVILNIPNMLQQDPMTMIKCGRHFLFPLSCKIDAQKREINVADWISKSEQITKKLRNISANVGAIVIDPIGFLCPKEECFLLDRNNKPVYKDSTHLTASYVREYGNFVDKVFED